MEDPIHFDIYAKALPHGITAAAAVLAAMGAYPSTLAARRAANYSRGKGKHVLVARGVTWMEGQQARIGAEVAFGEFLILQEGYAPGEAAHFCEKHGVYYGGCLGCHVCRGFHAK